MGDQYCNPVDLVQTNFGGNVAEKWILASPGKWGKSSRKWPEIPLLTHFQAIFLFF